MAAFVTSRQTEAHRLHGCKPFTLRAVLRLKISKAKQKLRNSQSLAFNLKVNGLHLHCAL